MDDRVFVVFILLGCGVILCYDKSFYYRKYHYVNINMKWIDAQSHCRAHYTDLAKFESREELNMVKRPPMEANEVWIGLNDDPRFWKEPTETARNSWRHSRGGLTSPESYFNWAPNQPDFKDASEQRVMLMPGGKWEDVNIRTLAESICFDGRSGVKVYTLIKNPTTFRHAELNCRNNSLYTDLARIDNEEENANAKSVLSMNPAWIGLHRQPWMWSDLTEVSFKNFKSGQPDNEQGNQHCVTEDSNHEWSDQQCDTERPFLCYEDAPIPKVRTVSIKFQSDADLGDPVINSQILEQISALLKNGGVTNVNLKWRNQPKKDKEQVGVTTCD